MAKVGDVTIGVRPHILPARRVRRPIEAKVIAGATGAGLAAPVAGLLLWVIEEYWIRGPVPAPVELFVLAVVPAVVAWIAAYSAPHTERPDLEEPGEIGFSPLSELLTAATPAPPTVNVYAGNSAREQLGPRADEVTVTGDAGQVLDFTTAAGARPGREPAPDMSTLAGRPTWLGKGVGADVDEFEGKGPAKDTPPPD